MAGDIITHIDDEAVQGLTLNQAVEKMRGAVNTSVRLKVSRKGSNEPVELKLTRDVIRIKAVRMRNEGDVGYIRITQFNEQTFENLEGFNRHDQQGYPGRQAERLCARSAQQSRRFA
jgi:carboxyl-terminal processing protease